LKSISISYLAIMLQKANKFPLRVMNKSSGPFLSGWLRKVRTARLPWGLEQA
jgi:hypothetical protein